MTRNLLLGLLACCYLQSCVQSLVPSVDLRRILSNGANAVGESPTMQKCRTVYRYQTYRLTCRVKGQYEAILWTKDNTPLFDQNKYIQSHKTTGDTTTFKLTIVDLANSDAGNYKLMVANDHGTAEKAFRLTNMQRKGPVVDLRNMLNSDFGENKVPRVGPNLQYCRGKFMDMSYVLNCMVDEEFDSIMWTKNDQPILNATKYEQTTKPEYNMMSFTLKIMNPTEEDIGAYKLMVGNTMATSENMFYVTDVEACSNTMKCFENPCTFWSCKSQPQAHCVVDMCRMENMCRHMWYIGMEPVTCEVEEGGGLIG